MKTYDVLVLGGGTAGTAAAKAAAQHGAKVAMFNKGELGGLCILRGCMPTKTMLHAAHLRHEAEHHRTPGIGHSIPSLDFGAVMANKDAKVARFKRAKIHGIEKGGYEVIDAYARFSGPDTVEADNGETYRFSKGAVLATGSDVHVPPIEGIEDIKVWDSDHVMKLKEVPESAIVIGSGAIGLELGQFLARMGTKVTQASRRPFLQDLGPLFSAEMERVLQDEPNLEPVSGFRPLRVDQQDGLVRLHIEKDGREQILSARHFIAATGRRAHLADMGLEAAGVQHDGRHVAHDPAMRTSNPRIFVAGDATGTRQLLHIANWEGAAAGKGAAEVPGDHSVNHRLHMEVIFTDPPLATLGLSEAELRAQGTPIKTAVASFPETGRAITMDVAHGLWQLVAHEKSGEILGTQILGPRADDMVHTVAAVMHYHGTAQDMLEMPWYHPTLSEVLLSLARELVPG